MIGIEDVGGFQPMSGYLWNKGSLEQRSGTSIIKERPDMGNIERVNEGC